MTLRVENDVSFLNDERDCSAQSTSLQHLEFDDGTVPMVKKTGGSGRMSPVRARTMKEYEQQIAELQKENFSLKLRIYFLEERMRKELDGSGEDIYKINIELQVEVESLKQDLVKKQDLLKQASNALESISSQHQAELQVACQTAVAEAREQARYDTAATEQALNDLRSQLLDSDQLVRKMRAELDESNEKLRELLAVNEMLDSHCRTLEYAKRDLEIQLEAAGDSLSDGEQGGSKIDMKDLLEKEKLIEQLRCGLRAKDVIIEQLEEEKKELAHETAQYFEERISELTEKVKVFESGADSRHSEVNGLYCESEMDFRALGSRASDSSSSPTVMCAEVEMHELDVSSLGRQLTDVKTSLEDVLQKKEAVEKKFQDKKLETDRLEDKIRDLESSLNQLKLELDAAGRNVADKDSSLKEMKAVLETERQITIERIATLNAEIKGLREAAERQTRHYEHTVEQLLDIIRHRDVNIHQHLTVNSQDISALPTRIADNVTSLADTLPISRSPEDAHNDSFRTVLTALQDAMNKVAAKDVEIKALQDGHSARVERLNHEIDSLQCRLAQTESEKQASWTQTDPRPVSASGITLEDETGKQVSWLSELRNLVATALNAVTLKDVQAALVKMERIFGKVAGRTSNRYDEVMDHSNNSTSQFQRLAFESFSSDGSSTLRMVSFGDVAKVCNVELDSSWLTAERQSLCDSIVPGDRVLISRDELIGLHSRIREQGEELALLNSLQKTRSNGSCSSSTGTVICTQEPESVDIDLKLNGGHHTESTRLEDTTMDIAHLRSSTKETLSNVESRTDLVRDLEAAKESECQLKDQLSQLVSKVSDLTNSLRCANDTIALLKRHIELNTPSDDNSSPEFNPDVIIVLAQEVERLNHELSKHQVEPLNDQATAQDRRGARVQTKLAPIRRSSIPVRTSSAHRDSGALSRSVGALNTDSNRSSIEQNEDASLRSSTGDINTSQRKPRVVIAEPSTSLPPSLPVLESQASSTLHTESSRTVPASDNSSGLPWSFDSEESQLVSIQRPVVTSQAQRLANEDRGGQTPFTTISTINQRTFRDLQAQVELLRRKLELTELENSRLLEASFMGIPRLDGQERRDTNDLLDTDSDQEKVTMPAGFLKKLVEAHKNHHDLLNRRLVESHGTCRILQNRMEQLVRFLEEMLTGTPALKSSSDLSLCLNETRSFLTDLSMNLNLGDETSQHDLELSTNFDFETSISRNEPSHDSLLHIRNQVQSLSVHQEVTKLCHLRDSLEVSHSELAARLAAVECELAATRSRNIELTTALENHQTTSSQSEEKFSHMAQQFKFTKSVLAEKEEQLQKANENLALAQGRNAKLLKNVHEMEDVLVIQEKKVTECEETVKRIKQETAEEKNKTSPSLLASIETLKAERDVQLGKVKSLEEELEWRRNEMKGERWEKLMRDQEAIDRRESMVGKLKSLVRENNVTAEKLRDELRRMSDEVVEKNTQIAELRNVCKELTIRCGELEAALCQSATDVDRSAFRGRSIGENDFLRARYTERSESTLNQQRSGESSSISASDHSSVIHIPAKVDTQTIDFETWCQQQGLKTLASESGVISEPIETYDARRKNSDADRRGSKNLLRTDTCHVDSSRTALGSQLYACGELERTIREIIKVCGKLRGMCSTKMAAGQGDQGVDDDQKLQQFLNQLEESLKSIASLRFRLKNNYEEVKNNSIGDHQSENSVSSQQLGEPGNGNLHRVLSLSRHQLVSSELELTSMRQRLEESTALNRALRLELEISNLGESNKENHQGETISRGFDLDSVFTEIRALREQLELSVASNELLHHKLDRYAENQRDVAPFHRPEGEAEIGPSGKAAKHAADPGSSTDRVQLAVVSMTGFKLLLTLHDEVSNLLKNLEKAFDALPLEAGGVESVPRRLLIQLTKTHLEQRRCAAGFTNITAPIDSSAASSIILSENSSLIKQLSQLKRKYAHLQQAMKSAQKQLDANNQRKQEQFSSTRDEAIIEQINITRKVLNQSTKHLERLHARSEPPIELPSLP